jgi:hypothetical protein
MNDYRRESVGCHSHRAKGFATFRRRRGLRLAFPRLRLLGNPSRRSTRVQIFTQTTPVCGKFVTLGLGAPLQEAPFSVTLPRPRREAKMLACHREWRVRQNVLARSRFGLDIDGVPASN